MNKIIIGGVFAPPKVFTVEEYIKYRMTQKYDPILDVGYSKAKFKKLAETEYGINNINSRFTKVQILEKILMRENIYVLARQHKIGALHFQYFDTFYLGAKQLLELEKQNFLKVIGKQKYYNSSIYDIEQFEKMSLDDILNALKKCDISFSEQDIRKQYNDNIEYCKEENVLKRQKEREKNIKMLETIEELAEYPELHYSFRN